jgi:nucleotide-binding universal stress UspA family protein
VYKHILAGTDFSDLGDKALLRAAELAVDLGARLTLVHVVGEEDAQNAMYGAHEARQVVEKLEAAHAKARGELAQKDKAKHIEVTCEVRVGAAADQILALAKDKGADLIVVASNGQKGLSRWLLGSVADKVVRGADVDVLVVS